MGESRFQGKSHQKFAEIITFTTGIWNLWREANDTYLNGFYTASFNLYEKIEVKLKEFWKDGACPEKYSYFRGLLQRRANEFITLDELKEFDWDIISKLETADDYINLFIVDKTEKQRDKFLFYMFTELKLMIFHRITLQLAKAEALKNMNSFNEAENLLRAILNETYLNKRIEIPYVKLRLSEVLLEWGDTLYKVGKIDNVNEVEGAVDKYLQVLQVFPAYLKKTVAKTPDDLPDDIVKTSSVIRKAIRRQFHFSDQSLVYNKLLKNSIVNLNSIELDRKIKSGFAIDQITSNPLVLRSMKLATIGLIKIDSNLNYFGYHDDYVPIWRYKILLESTRYFLEKARSAERDYLNFYEKGYAEEEKARTLSQSIATQTMSCKIANEKVKQQKKRVDIAGDQVSLFDMRKKHAKDNASDAIAVGYASAFSFSTSVSIGFPKGGSVSAGVSFSPGAIAQGYYNAAKLDRQRREMGAQQSIARKEKEVAKTELKISEISRDIDNLNLTFANNNLNYLRSKPLNKELWFNLGRTMRDMSRQYLNQSIMLAWLTEQAYEYEYDKKINIIKFDYSNAASENMLGADILLRDLDAIEYDRLSTVKTKETPLKHTISLSELDPIAFQRFTKNGLLNFSTSLESLDTKFPGTYLARIKGIEVKLNALVGKSSVVAGRVTHRGVSMFRFVRKEWTQTPPPFDAEYGNSFSSNVVQDYLYDSGEHDFYLKLSSGPAETLALSQFSLKEDSVYFEVEKEHLKLFEDIGYAGEWTLEISPSSNDFDFNTILDAEITFYLSANYDEELRYRVENHYRYNIKNAINENEPPVAGLPRIFSQLYPDAYYLLNNPISNETIFPVEFSVRKEIFPMNHENIKLLKIHLYTAAEKRDLSQYKIEINDQTKDIPGGELVTKNCSAPVSFDFENVSLPLDLTICFKDSSGNRTIIEDLDDIGIIFEYRYDIRGLGPVIDRMEYEEPANLLTLKGRGYDFKDKNDNKVEIDGVSTVVNEVNSVGTEMKVTIPSGVNGYVTIENVWGKTISDKTIK